MSGILGLAYGSISVDSLPTFIDSSDLTDKSFAFYLHNNPDLSYMTIPGYEQSAFNGEMQFHNVAEQKNTGHYNSPPCNKPARTLLTCPDTTQSLIQELQSSLDPRNSLTSSQKVSLFTDSARTLKPSQTLPSPLITSTTFLPTRTTLSQLNQTVSPNALTESWVQPSPLHSTI